MKPEDSQIDVLLRRYGSHAKGAPAAEHLDADELNAFAEGAAPAAARSRYVSHLVECDDCRGLATQLSIAAGATASAGAGAIDAASGSFWQKLTSFFAPPKLRYAAFAAVLVAAVGVTFVVIRQQRNDSPLIVQSERPSQKEVGAAQSTQPSAPATRATNDGPQTFSSPSGIISQPNATPYSDLKKDESKVGDTAAAPPKPEKEGAASADQPVFAAKKAAEPATVIQQPSYAPLPPGETGRAQIQTRDERSAQREATVSGPRKSDPPSDKLKQMDSVGGLPQNRAAEGDDNRARSNQAMTNQQTTNQQSQNRGQESNAEAPRAGNLAMNRSGNEEKTETASKPASSPARRDAEKSPETRSVAGHKFRRQDNAWVDTRFKSSMSVTNVARGSDGFRALDSALRSMADQLGGDVIVVSKGKAYRIR